MHTQQLKQPYVLPSLVAANQKQHRDKALLVCRRHRPRLLLIAGAARNTSWRQVLHVLIRGFELCGDAFAVHLHRPVLNELRHCFAVVGLSAILPRRPTFNALCLGTVLSLERLLGPESALDIQRCKVVVRMQTFTCQQRKENTSRANAPKRCEPRTGPRPCNTVRKLTMLYIGKVPWPL